MKYLLVSLALFVASGVRAQELPPSLRPIEKALGDQTILIGRLEPAGIDVPTVLGLFKGVFPSDGAPDPAAAFEHFQTQWSKIGGREVYFLVSMDSLLDGPILAFPVGVVPSDGALAAFWKDALGLPDLVHRRFDGLVVAGTKEQLDRVAKNETKPNPALVAGFAAVALEGGPIQVAASATADTRRIFEETSPTLPKELGGGSVQLLTRGIKHVRLSVGKAPKIAARLTLECAEATDAARVLPLWKSLLQRALDDLPADLDETTRAFAVRLKTLLEPEAVGRDLVVAIDGAASIREFVKMYAQTPDRGERIRSANNIGQLVLAFQTYTDEHGYFPRDIRSKDGKVLLSWRVLLLPYLEQDALYKQFKLDEAWDSERNKPLLAKMPAIFRSPKQAKTLADKTTYLAPIGQGLAWDIVPKDRKEGLRFQDIADGTSNTIVLVEADDDVAVEWTRPADLSIDRKQPEQHLKGHYRTVMLVGILDGSVKTISVADWKGEELWWWFTRAGGEVIPIDGKPTKPIPKK